MIVIAGKSWELPGSMCWHDDSRMRITTNNKRPRTTKWIKSIGVHCTKGDEPQVVLPGIGPSGMAHRTVSAWADGDRYASAHVAIDGDGTIWCLADLFYDVTFHAGSINESSIGVEICQTKNNEIWQCQLDNLLLFLDRVTYLLTIQRQFPWPYLGEAHPVRRLANGGLDFIGIFGHRDQTTQRGPGDPGNAVYETMRLAAYEPRNVDADEDKHIWSRRQESLGVKADGIPGPLTAAAIKNATGNPIWVPRPGD